MKERGKIKESAEGSSGGAIGDWMSVEGVKTFEPEEFAGDKILD